MKKKLLNSLKFIIFGLLALSLINTFIRVVDNNFISIIIFTLLLSIFYIIAEIYEKNLHKSIKTYKWIETEGIVLEHKIRKEENFGEIRLIPEIRYKYQVNNKTYESITYSFDDIYFYSEFEVKNFFELRPIKQFIPVYVNPKNVKISVLEKGSVDLIKRFATIFLLFIMIDLVYILENIFLY